MTNVETGTIRNDLAGVDDDGLVGNIQYDHDHDNEDDVNGNGNGNNMNDITIIDDGSDDDDDDDGGNDGDSVMSDEFNLAAAKSLRKNLTMMFDKHVHASSVSEKIAQFENKTGGRSKPPRAPQNLQQQRGSSSSSSSSTLTSSRSDAKSLLNVVLRIRPPTGKTSHKDGGVDSNTSTIEIVEPTGGSSGGVQATIRTYPPSNSNAAKVVRDDTVQGVKEFRFQQVFGPESTQHDVYSSVAAPLVHGLFPSSDQQHAQQSRKVGESALLFAYGITNAGKTHTVMGDVRSTAPNSQWGIIPRALGDIFARLEGNGQYELFMSYMEVYNEHVYDLLPTTEQPSYMQRPNLKVRERRDGQTFVRGLAKHRVGSVAHGLELAAKAKTKRQTSSNNINAGSSRSHCICQLELVYRSAPAVVTNTAAPVASKAPPKPPGRSNGYSTDEEASQLMAMKDRRVSMWIVDLAGSERVKRTGMLAGSARQKEASLINASLMKLMRCLSVMKDNQQSKQSSSSGSVVPFRESKLTHLFVGHLTGPSASRTCMVVNVNPAASDFDETQHVLSYAVAAKTVQISKEALSKKRKDMGFLDDYDSNGHKKGGKRQRQNTKGGGESRTTRIANLVRKYSPKNFKKVRLTGGGRRGDNATTSAGPGPAVAAAAAAAKTGMAGRLGVAFGGVSKPKDGSGKANKPAGATVAGDAKGMPSASMELSVAKAESESLRLENSELEERIASIETEIREEVVEEMEQHMHTVRIEYDRIISSLEEQLHETIDNEKDSRLEGAERMIAELKEKVVECEEEMVRMRHDHERAVALATKDLQAKLEAANKTIAAERASSQKLTMELSVSQQKVKDLEAQLRPSNPGDNHHQVQQQQQQQQQSWRVLRSSRSRDEGDSQRKSDENSSDDGRTSNDPASESDDTAPTDAESVPSVAQIYTKNLRTSQQRKPFSERSGNFDKNIVNMENSAESESAADLMFPKKPAVKDTTGRFSRPMGRAPKGREWDTTTGAWRLSSQ